MFCCLQPTMEEVKIILLGDSGVGKTSLITRFISDDDDSFARKNSAPRSSQFDPDVKAKEVEINGITIKAHFHDSPGKDTSYSSHSIAPNFYRNADAVILVYSVNDQHTLEALQDCFVTEYATYADISATSWIIVGNKNDLPLDIEKSVLDDLSRCLGKSVALFASAKTGKNVKEVLHIAVKKAHERRKQKEGTFNLKEERQSNRGGQGGCCGRR